MFSGIVERMATLIAIEKEGTNVTFSFRSDITTELHIDQSVSHNGVCLTVVELDGDVYKVTAMLETLLKSNLGELKLGDKVNLERSMRPDALLDGHIVQGHVDTTAQCVEVRNVDGSYYYKFVYIPQGGGLTTVEKGSVAINGVSLTVIDSSEGQFSVAIIPYTYEYTNFHKIEVGTIVNLEFDIIGKYIARLMENYVPKK